ncbi:hypothetical protein BUALT_Bualt05G0116300 [Buddleja alternifolia]|uniref:RING-CH-type domain-containing protein n=1 Tax=Buddleja alternifolia TaxID=168488 RepID=A0AAV6XJY7_9LAMI|nr:hypothetical protein BUALT_Bualt05G0116300 [Buddleja alternifolia]
MGDHFVLLVDRLLTESTLEAAIESRNLLKQADPMTIDDTMIDCSSENDSEDGLSPRKVVECRICQDEDFDTKMEAPCSCCGSLKYAHRRCVQRWCNEKGDTVCEICHQQFKPGYTAPPPIFRFGGLQMNLRGNWQIARRDLNNPRIITMVSTDRSFLDTDYDEYAASLSRSIICCRLVAIIFMILLILRHTLPVLVNRAGNYSFPLIMLLMLRVAGIILPICIILKAVTSIVRRRHQHQQANLSVPPSDEEGRPETLHQHVIAVR